ncbi:hypothetical protein [Gordonia sp. VNK21]|uniref:hypothetical protein n=1 Tax=Gordonia sp. VNK21 TaxID=3382483 RepID=UPI0038D413DC
MEPPQGPLPTEVYWRRRLLAGGIAVVVVAVVIGLIVWAGSSGGGDDNSTSKNAAVGSSVESAPATTEPEAPATGESPADAPAQTSASESAAPSENPAQTTPAQGQEGAAQCTDQALSVVLYTDKPTYTRGDQPVFTIVTTNGGLADCSRDVGKASQNVIVRSLDGTRTLWSAQDCAPDKTVNHTVLKPGQQVTDDVTWSGTTSNPGCTKARTEIPVGAYQAVAKVGERESAPITFNVVAPAQQ